MTLTLLALAGLAFTAHSLSVSAARTHPRYDEVAYLARAREYAREGGALPTIRCHLEGRCPEDNRHPLYLLLLQLVATDTPRAFADGRLVTLATALLLLATVYGLARRAFGAPTAALAAALLALGPALGELSASLLADVLFAALFVAAVWVIGAWQERGVLAWLGMGALIGLAWLAKGSAHLLFLPLLAVGLWRHRLRLLARPGLYAALAGFAAVGAFLLWRNAEVYGNPLHNLNARIAWLDDWESVWTLYRDPEWEDVGLAWYLERHSFFDLAWRVVKGMGTTLGTLAYSAGVGLDHIAARAATGTAVLALAAWGLVGRWRTGRRAEILAVVATLGTFLLALGLGAEAGIAAPRLAFPLAVLLLPFAVHPIALRAPRAVAVGLAIALCVRLALSWEGLARDPRAHLAVPPAWQRTSAWLAANLAPGERFALSHQSEYSTWDRPRPDADPRWPYAFAADRALLERHLAEHRIRKALIDAEDRDLPRYTDKLSQERDLHGPLRFLGWPRCFADGGTPSRFLVYCGR